MMPSILLFFYWLSSINSVRCLLTAMQSTASTVRLVPNVYAENWESRSCSRILHHVRRRPVTVELSPSLTGQWASRRCEIRSGPQFVLRSYTFKGNHFVSSLYVYQDVDCSRPLYSLTATGSLRFTQKSQLVPGSTENQYSLEQVTLVTYDNETSHLLLLQLKSTCPPLYHHHYLRPFRRYTIMRGSNPNYFPVRSKTIKSNLAEFDCTSAFNFTLNELQLVRVESVLNTYPSILGSLSKSKLGKNRTVIQRNSKRKWPTRARRTLSLGAVHTEMSQRQQHRASSFQEPLQDTMDSLCGTCNRVINALDVNPPRLHEKHGTLITLKGKWVSSRCETRQYGQFLTRWLHFLKDDRSWEGRYDYYQDALCREPSFSLKAKGSYAAGKDNDVIKGSKMFIFKTTRLKVTPQDSSTVDILNKYQGSECGKAGYWKLGDEQDVTPTKGCVTLGIQLPNMEQDLIRMETGHHKLFLFVSQRSTNHPIRPYYLPPPTSFQPPLSKCDSRYLKVSFNSLPGDTFPEAVANLKHDNVYVEADSIILLSASTSGLSADVTFVLIVSLITFFAE